MAGDHPVDQKPAPPPANHSETETSLPPANDSDALLSTNLVRPGSKTNRTRPQKDYKLEVNTARQLRRNLDHAGADKLLVNLLESDMPPEFRRAALFELALVAQEQKQFSRAQQILAQYLHLYPQDSMVPEVLLRQGLLFRQMGAHNTAIAKFYAVMNSALGLQIEQFDYYQRLVLQAQTEIADTYYIQGKFTEAADFFGRILKQNSGELNRPQIHFKFVRCLSSLGRQIGRAHV